MKDGYTTVEGLALALCWPALAWAILLISAFLGVGELIAAIAGVALFGTMFATVYHAEVVAHRVGEPFGTLVLALAVTVIETALIVSVMIAAPTEKAGLARDTVFAAVKIVCNGIVGSCLLWGGARHLHKPRPGCTPALGWPRGPGPWGNLRIAVVDDEIIVSLPGTSYGVTHFKRPNSPQLLAKNISNTDDFRTRR